MNDDLEQMSREDLLALQKQVKKALDTYQDRRKQDALVEMQEVARRHGLDLNEIIGNKKKASVSAPKFRHPDNPSLTWAGKGRKPHWLNEELSDGRNLEDFRI